MKLTVVHGATGGPDNLIGVLGDLGHVAAPVVARPGLQVLVISRSRRTLRLLFDVIDVAALLEPFLPEAEGTGAAQVHLGTPLAVELFDLRQAVVAVFHFKTCWQGLQINHRPVLYVLAVEVHTVILVDGFSTRDCYKRNKSLLFFTVISHLANFLFDEFYFEF